MNKVNLILGKPLNKYKHSESDSEKYKDNNAKLIIKIGSYDLINYDYKMSEVLSDIPGFVKYISCDECNNNIIIKNSYIMNKEKVMMLIMEEYPLGNVKNFNWNQDNFYILKSVIKQMILSFYFAFKKIGLIYSNFHFGNILLKKYDIDKIKYQNYHIDSFGYCIVITDLENGTLNFLTKNLWDILNTKSNFCVFNDDIDKSKLEYSLLYSRFIQIINNINWRLNIIMKNSNELITYLYEIEKHNTDMNEVHINKLLLLIDKLEFQEKWWLPPYM